MTRRSRPLLLAACLLLAGCWNDGVVCADFFRIFTVYLQDPAGAPVADATVTSILVRTGDTLQNRTLALLAPGSYFLIDDSYNDLIAPVRDSVSVSITRGLAELEAGYVFRRGACWVEKVAGPDSLTVPG